MFGATPGAAKQVCDGNMDDGDDQILAQRIVTLSHSFLSEWIDHLYENHLPHPFSPLVLSNIQDDVEERICCTAVWFLPRLGREPERLYNECCPP